MTLEDLFMEVQAFSGGQSIGERNIAISVANRALRELYYSIPITKTVKFNVTGHKPTTYYKKIVCKAGESITLPLVGKAYSFRVVGYGNYTINDGATTIKQFDSGNESLLVRGFLNNDGTIRFWGNFTIVIYDFSTYDEMFSPDPSSIPDGSPISTIDVKALYEDFLTFVSPPTDRYGNIIENCRMHEGLLEIDSSFSGEIVLTYRKYPKQIFGIDEEKDYLEVLDVEKEHEALLVYLYWYNFWCLVDETKAKSYRNRADDLIELLNDSYRSIDSNYIDVNGWA